MKKVYYIIRHPGTGKPELYTSFEEAMDKSFEGFNLPVKYTAESFEESNQRVHNHYQSPQP